MKESRRGGFCSEDAEKCLNEFYDLITKPDRLKKTLVTNCKPASGM